MAGAGSGLGRDYCLCLLCNGKGFHWGTTIGPKYVAMQIMYRKELIPVLCGDPNLALMLLPCDDIVKLWSLKDNLFVISWL